MNNLNHSELLSLLSYDRETGLFTRNITVGRCGRWKAGSAVGHLASNGYVQIYLNGKSYLAHRLAWFYVHSEWPKKILDHKNGVRHENNINNLRECDDALNMQNIRTSHKDNSTGLLGVKKLPSGRYQARIYVNKKEQNLGIFNTPCEAHAAYVLAKRRLHEFCTI